MSPEACRGDVCNHHDDKKTDLVVQRVRKNTKILNEKILRHNKQENEKHHKHRNQFTKLEFDLGIRITNTV